MSYSMIYSQLHLRVILPMDEFIKSFFYRDVFPLPLAFGLEISPKYTATK